MDVGIVSGWWMRCGCGVGGGVGVDASAAGSPTPDGFLKVSRWSPDVLRTFSRPSPDVFTMLSRRFARWDPRRDARCALLPPLAGGFGTIKRPSTPTAPHFNSHQFKKPEWLISNLWAFGSSWFDYFLLLLLLLLLLFFRLWMKTLHVIYQVWNCWQMRAVYWYVINCRFSRVDLKYFFPFLIDSKPLYRDGMLMECSALIRHFPLINGVFRALKLDWIFAQVWQCCQTCDIHRRGSCGRCLRVFLVPSIISHRNNDDIAQLISFNSARLMSIEGDWILISDEGDDCGFMRSKWMESIKPDRWIGFKVIADGGTGALMSPKLTGWSSVANVGSVGYSSRTEAMEIYRGCNI